MPVESIISILLAFGALMFTAFSFRRTQNQDTSASASERATMTADIRYIRMSIDEIKLDNKAIKTEVGELQQRVAKIEQSVSSAHKRIDDLKG